MRYSVSPRRALALGFALLTSLCASAGFAADANLKARLDAPRTLARITVSDSTKLDHIVIKFREGSGIRLRTTGLVVEPARFQASTALPVAGSVTTDLTQLSSLFAAYGVQPRALFKLSEKLLDQWKADGERKSGEQLADLNLYASLPIPSGYTAAQIQQLLDRFNALSSVEIAYARPRTLHINPASKPPLPAALTSVMFTPKKASLTFASGTTPDLRAYQGYLTNAPWGIDAAYAVSQKGGRGTNVKVIDVNIDWLDTHEDGPAISYSGGVTIGDGSGIFYGTPVLGIVGAKDNSFGITGIAPDAMIGHEGIADASMAPDQDTSDRIIASGITNAALAAGTGGIVMFTLDVPGPDMQTCKCATGCNAVAVEYFQAEYDAIKNATANGVIVVEAAGTGESNLDSTVYNGAFNRSMRDSGAILVAASAGNRRAPACSTNYGSRIDSHGWGYSVATTGFSTSDFYLPGLYEFGNDLNTYYTEQSSGTTSATPIVASAAAALQGVALAQLGRVMSPAEIRSSLTVNGSPQETSLTRRIGSLPDLRTSIKKLLGTSGWACRQFTSSVDDHVGGGRAYKSGTNYFTKGANQFLGTSSSTKYTLQEFSAANFAVGFCFPRFDAVYAPWINSTVYTAGSDSITVSGTASDPNYDIARVEVEFDNEGVWRPALGTTNWSITKKNMISGTYTYRVRAVDYSGRISPSSIPESSNFLSEILGRYFLFDAGKCQTSNPATHLISGRAHWCDENFTRACINGSNQDIGNPYSDLIPVSLKETSWTGRWAKADSCN
jgi:serine protease